MNYSECELVEFLLLNKLKNMNSKYMFMYIVQLQVQMRLIHLKSYYKNVKKKTDMSTWAKTNVCVNMV